MRNRVLLLLTGIAPVITNGFAVVDKTTSLVTHANANNKQRHYVTSNELELDHLEEQPHLLEEDHLHYVEHLAEFCIGNGKDSCSVDEIETTIDDLQEQRKIIHKKVDDLNYLLFRIRQDLGIHFDGEHTTFLMHNPQSVPDHDFSQKLNPVDLMCIENMAEFCLERGKDTCDVDDAEAIANQLKNQRDFLLKEEYHISSLLQDLSVHKEYYDINSLLDEISHEIFNEKKHLWTESIEEKGEDHIIPESKWPKISKDRREKIGIYDFNE